MFVCCLNFVLLFRGFRLDACYFFANRSQTCAAIYHILKILTEWVVGNKRTSSHNNREVPFFDKKIIVNSTKQPISKNIVLPYKQQTKIDQFLAAILSHCMRYYFKAVIWRCFIKGLSSGGKHSARSFLHKCQKLR